MTKKKNIVQKHKKEKVRDFKLEISRLQADVKTFIERFRSDVKKKKKAFQGYAQNIRNKK